MTTHGPPASPGATTASTSGVFQPGRSGWLRLLGGVVFAAGGLVLALRKRDWSDWALLLVLLVPCALLYALAITGGRRDPARAGDGAGGGAGALPGGAPGVL